MERATKFLENITSVSKIIYAENFLRIPTSNKLSETFKKFVDNFEDAFVIKVLKKFSVDVEVTSFKYWGSIRNRERNYFKEIFLKCCKSLGKKNVLKII